MSTYPVKLVSFLSARDLADLVVPAQGWHPSVVVDDDGRVRTDPMRTSTQQRLTAHHAIMRRIRRRVADLGAAGALPPDLRFGGDASLVKYEVGQRYGAHGDAAGMSCGREWTVLVCLRAADDGGETRFVHLRRSFSLARGDALAWPNYDGAGENERMDHEALPVTRGVKVVANVWFDRGP